MDLPQLSSDDRKGSNSKIISRFQCYASLCKSVVNGSESEEVILNGSNIDCSSSEELSN